MPDTQTNVRPSPPVSVQTHVVMWRGRPAWIRPLAPDSSRQLNSCPSASLAVAEHPTYACVCLDSWPYVLYQQGHSKSVQGLVMSTRVKDPDLWGHRVNTAFFLSFLFLNLVHILHFQSTDVVFILWPHVNYIIKALLEEGNWNSLYYLI